MVDDDAGDSAGIVLVMVLSLARNVGLTLAAWGWLAAMVLAGSDRMAC